MELIISHLLNGQYAGGIVSTGQQQLVTYLAHYYACCCLAEVGWAAAAVKPVVA
jgi:hypothetical protein